MTDAQSRPIPRGSRRPEFQALASGPHRLAAANRGLVRQVSRPHKLRRLKGDRRRFFGIGLRQRKPVVQRIKDWWQSRSKNKYDRQPAAEADGERGGVMGAPSIWNRIRVRLTLWFGKLVCVFFSHQWREWDADMEGTPGHYCARCYDIDEEADAFFQAMSDMAPAVEASQEAK